MVFVVVVVSGLDFSLFVVGGGFFCLLFCFFVFWLQLEGCFLFLCFVGLFLSLPSSFCFLFCFYLQLFRTDANTKEKL